MYSAWVGAVWERMIKTVKLCLYKSVGKQLLGYHEMLTLISNIQLAVNSRPLTYMSSDDDMNPITPNSFLKHNARKSIFLKQEEDYMWNGETPDREQLVEELSLQEETFQRFKERWYQEYLLNLREQYRELHQADWQNRIAPGDVVLLKLPNKPRPYWLLGIVLDLVFRHDNKVRSVKIKRGDGTITHHSINLLYPLELSVTHTTRYTPDDSPLDDDAESYEPSEDQQEFRPVQPLEQEIELNDEEDSRPRRTAAQACNQRMAKWCRQLQ